MVSARFWLISSSLSLHCFFCRFRRNIKRSFLSHSVVSFLISALPFGPLWGRDWDEEIDRPAAPKLLSRDIRKSTAACDCTKADRSAFNSVRVPPDRLQHHPAHGPDKQAIGDPLCDDIRPGLSCSLRQTRILSEQVDNDLDDNGRTIHWLSS